MFRLRHVVLSYIATLAFIGAFIIKVHVDEGHLSQVSRGMTIRQLRRALGEPTETVRWPLPAAFEPRMCSIQRPVTAALYFRSLRPSLLVYLDERACVVCAERVRLVNGIHPLEGQGSVALFTSLPHAR